MKKKVFPEDTDPAFAQFLSAAFAVGDSLFLVPGRVADRF
jgi:hypothetical protein